MNSAKFRIRQEETKAGHTLYLEGELDLSTASQLRSFTDPLILRNEDKFVLNLKGLKYIDSTGIGAIISILKARERMNTSLYIEEIPPKIKRLFDLTGITKFIAVTQ